jgi:hypothetical protein
MSHLRRAVACYRFYGVCIGGHTIAWAVNAQSQKRRQAAALQKCSAGRHVIRQFREVPA